MLRELIAEERVVQALHAIGTLTPCRSCVDTQSPALSGDGRLHQLTRCACRVDTCAAHRRVVRLVKVEVWGCVESRGSGEPRLFASLIPSKRGNINRCRRKKLHGTVCAEACGSFAEAIAPRKVPRKLRLKTCHAADILRLALNVHN